MPQCQAKNAQATRPHVIAAWAQIRVGAAIARLCTDALEGAAEEVAPVLELPPEFRMATVTGWLEDFGRRLGAYRYVGNPVADRLQEQVRGFSEVAVTERLEGTRR